MKDKAVVSLRRQNTCGTLCNNDGKMSIFVSLHPPKNDSGDGSAVYFFHLHSVS